MIAAADADRERGVWPKRVILTQRAPKVAFPSGRFARGGAAPECRRTTIFRRRVSPGFAARNKIAVRLHPPLRFGPCHPTRGWRRVQGGSASGKRSPVKAAMGAADCRERTRI